jgi:hypothetical protein
VVPWILKWLMQTPNLPYDHVFGHLAHNGAAIRVAEPNLCIAELDKVSEVNKGRTSVGPDAVYKLHHWTPGDYLE